MGLAKRDREFRLPKISYLDFKLLEMDRVLTSFLARVWHSGYPSRILRNIELTVEDFVNEFIEHPENRTEAARILAQPERIGVDAEVIQRTLTGRLKISPDGTFRESGRYLLVGREGAGRPDPVQHQQHHRAGSPRFPTVVVFGTNPGNRLHATRLGPPSHWRCRPSPAVHDRASGRSGRLNAMRRRPERGAGAASIRS